MTKGVKHPMSEACATCTADQRLEKIEGQLALILKIVDKMAQAIQELTLKKR